MSTRDKAKEKTHKVLNSNNNNYLNPLLWVAKASVFSRAMPQIKYMRALPDRIGKIICELNTVLPGKHIKVIYNTLNKRDTKILI